MRRLVVFSSLLALVLVAGCRNTVVDDVRPDAGPDGEEGEGEAGEGEGEGEGEDPCAVDPPAVSVRVADGEGFVYCDPQEATVRLTVAGAAATTAEIVTVAGDGCRHQGGFGVPGSYTVDVTVTGFAPEQVLVDVPANACNDPVTTTLQVTVEP